VLYRQSKTSPSATLDVWSPNTAITGFSLTGNINSYYQANIKNFVSLIANRAVKLTNATFGKQIIITDLTPTPMRYVATTK
jgi:hypothetical protein